MSLFLVVLTNYLEFLFFKKNPKSVSMYIVSVILSQKYPYTIHVMGSTPPRTHPRPRLHPHSKHRVMSPFHFGSEKFMY